MSNHKYLEIKTSAEHLERDLETIVNIAVEHGLLFIGGGFGVLSMLSEEYDEKDLADEVVEIVMQQTQDIETEMIKGFLLEPTENPIDIHKADYVISEIKDKIFES